MVKSLELSLSLSLKFAWIKVQIEAMSLTCDSLTSFLLLFKPWHCSTMDVEALSTILPLVIGSLLAWENGAGEGSVQAWK